MSRTLYFVCLTVCFALFPVSKAWAGAQRDAVCQGSCGGGCGPCPSGGSNGGGSLVGVGQILSLPFTIFKALTPDQSSGLTPSQEEAHALNDKGAAAFNARNYVVAADYFSQALQMTPNDQNIRTNLATAQSWVLDKQGLAALNSGDYATAADYFRQALLKEPNDQVLRKNLVGAESLVLNDKGVAASNARDYATAADYFRQALLNDPNDQVIRTNLAKTQQHE